MIRGHRLRGCGVLHMKSTLAGLSGTVRASSRTRSPAVASRGIIPKQSESSRRFRNSGSLSGYFGNEPGRSLIESTRPLRSQRLGRENSGSGVGRSTYSAALCSALNAAVFTLRRADITSPAAVHRVKGRALVVEESRGRRSRTWCSVRSSSTYLPLSM
jgi:hypothetical protein